MLIEETSGDIQSNASQQEEQSFFANLFQQNNKLQDQKKIVSQHQTPDHEKNGVVTGGVSPNDARVQKNTHGKSKIAKYKCWK